MNRKIIVLTLLFTIVAGTNNMVFAADSLTEQFGIQVSGDATFILQGTSKLNNTTESNNGENDATYSFDLKLTKDFGNDGKIVLGFEGGRGLGLSQKLDTYAAVNIDADNTVNTAAGYVQPKITQLFYEKSFLNKKLIANFGKLNFGSYFTGNNYAGDGAQQFVTESFAGDPLVENPGQRVALRLNYAVCNNIDVSCAYFTTDVNHFDTKGVGIIQATYKHSPNGNYRVYAWTNNGDHYSFKNNNEKSGIHSIGISADQAINEEIGVFARLAYKDPSVYSTKLETDPSTQKETEKLNAPTSLFWSIGGQLKGSAWSRAKDVVGLALGQIYTSSDARGKTLYDYENIKDGAETQIELYYKFALNKHLALTPALQYFVNPKGGNAAIDKNIIVYGIRTQIDF
ncbi:MAG: carbohydrate porin [Endomicrobium sp.]|jgi:carbohydrate-selective porin OprB|nr:carbohydrate porin [Endomicrobium sp.]